MNRRTRRRQKTRRGRRSKEARQRRFVNQLVRKNSHEDLRKKEAINVLDQREIRIALNTKFGYAHVGVSQIFEKGEVLSDGRGEGSLQKRDEEDDE